MEANPDMKRHLLISSDHRKHRKEALEMTKRVAESVKKAQEIVEEAKKED